MSTFKFETIKAEKESKKYCPLLKEGIEGERAGFLNCIYWLEAIESNWMKRSVIYERLSQANYLSIHSFVPSFIHHSLGPRVRLLHV